MDDDDNYYKGIGYNDDVYYDDVGDKVNNYNKKARLFLKYRFEFNKLRNCIKKHTNNI